MLALGVLVLVFIHVLILISFIIADQNNFNTHLIPSLENSREEKGVSVSNIIIIIAVVVVIVVVVVVLLLLLLLQLLLCCS